MAAHGGNAFLEKVSRLISKEHGKPVLKPNRPLALRDAVANRKLKKGGKTRNATLQQLQTNRTQNILFLNASVLSHFLYRGNLYYRDVGDDGLLEAKRLCRCPLLK